MPVTAKLSKRFYDRFGEDIVNELVEWFNAVDATYRSDLKEINELNYARFEAKLEQRLSELRGELKSDIAGLRAEFKGDLGSLKAELIKWMFVFWSGSAFVAWLLR